MFIQTEVTPNPATLKFLPGRVVLPEGTFDATDAAAATSSPLATRLFAIPDVSGVFFGFDFVSVSKSAGDWQHLKPAVLGAIMEHFMSGAPVIDAGQPAQIDPDGEFFEDADAETVDTIKELLETRVRPAVAGDGGDIVFKGYKDGTVYLSMKGSCAGCPSSTATLKNGVENLFRHFLPDVRSVEAV
jgi:Fe-S cluster biogenesis protein NfuA